MTRPNAARAMEQRRHHTAKACGRGEASRTSVSCPRIARNVGTSRLCVRARGPRERDNRIVRRHWWQTGTLVRSTMVADSHIAVKVFRASRAGARLSSRTSWESPIVSADRVPSNVDYRRRSHCRQPLLPPPSAASTSGVSHPDVQNTHTTMQQEAIASSASAKKGDSVCAASQSGRMNSELPVEAPGPSALATGVHFVAATPRAHELCPSNPALRSEVDCLGSERVSWLSLLQ